MALAGAPSVTIQWRATAGRPLRGEWDDPDGTIRLRFLPTAGRGPHGTAQGPEGRIREATHAHARVPKGVAAYPASHDDGSRTEGAAPTTCTSWRGSH